MMGDEAFKELAEATRAALALMGKDIEPRCLPGERDPCGRSYAEHAVAHLAAMAAIIDHQLTVIGPEFVACIYPDVYAATAEDIAERCHHEPRPNAIELTGPGGYRQVIPMMGGEGTPDV